MNPLKSQNTVAKIIQVYAYLNAIAGAILSLIVAVEFSGIVAVCSFCVISFASFMLYAFGEIIALLQGIKNNTYRTNERVVGDDDDDELPEL